MRRRPGDRVILTPLVRRLGGYAAPRAGHRLFVYVGAEDLRATALPALFRRLERPQPSRPGSSLAPAPGVSTMTAR